MKKLTNGYQEEVLLQITKYLIKRITFWGDIENSETTFNWSELAKYLNSIHLFTERNKVWNKDNLRVYVSRISKDIKDYYCPDFDELNSCVNNQYHHRYIPKLNSHSGWEDSVHHKLDLSKMYNLDILYE
tara:strand:+ start:118 stop:507 length:390 start_codon:yes stop_codon:yes gene_type:complete